VSAARQKKGIFGQHRAKAGQYAAFFAGRSFRDNAKPRLRVRAGVIDAMSLPVSVVAIPIQGTPSRVVGMGLSITNS
jgi:ABC-type Co2+ transport system permease subunit